MTMEGGELASKDWVTTTQIMEIAGCGVNEARMLLKKANDQSRKEGNEIPNSRKAHRRRIMKLCGLKYEDPEAATNPSKAVTASPKN